MLIREMWWRVPITRIGSDNCSRKIRLKVDTARQVGARGSWFPVRLVKMRCRGLVILVYNARCPRQSAARSKSKSKCKY